jgi:hypothetical protein
VFNCADHIIHKHRFCYMILSVPSSLIQVFWIFSEDPRSVRKGSIADRLGRVDCKNELETVCEACLFDRRLVRLGFYADLVLFDPKAVIDNATYSGVPAYPSGHRACLCKWAARRIIRSTHRVGPRPAPRARPTSFRGSRADCAGSTSLASVSLSL